jgi:hypothetical protein
LASEQDFVLLMGAWRFARLLLATPSPLMRTNRLIFIDERGSGESLPCSLQILAKGVQPTIEAIGIVPEYATPNIGH